MFYFYNRFTSYIIMNNTNTLFRFFFMSMLSILTYGQHTKSTQQLYRELPDDAYIPTHRSNMPKTAAYRYRNSLIFTNQVNIDADGNNIVGDAANEPSIAFDPNNPDRIVIGWRQFDNINSNFRQAGYAYSTDAGDSWTFPGPIDPGVFRSDPVLDFDTAGNFYYNSLTLDESNNMHCDVYRIQDGGVAWDDGIYAKGGDKQWMRIDKTEGIGAGNNYSFWSSSFSACSGSFTRSTDLGDSYENCIPVSGDPYWGTLAVNASGDLFIAGGGEYPITLVKSTTAKDPNQNVTWDSVKSVNLDGDLTGWSPINPSGLLGQVWVDVDSNNDNVYVLCAVERTSNGDPGDIMFARSTDGGETFESPIRINTDSGTSAIQWFGTMSVAPNGRIDVVWLDTRDAPSDSPHDSALYYSYSTDQGITWSENQQMSDYFNPHIGYPQQNKMGDYFDMKSDNDGAHLAWTNTLNGGEDVYYSYITPENLGISDYTHNSVLGALKNYPNPFIDRTTISFVLKERTGVSIDIFDLLGKQVKSLTATNLSPGKHTIVWDGTNANGTHLSSGFYQYRITANNFSSTKKMLMLR